jgi:carboxypeptidase PM20D1
MKTFLKVITLSIFVVLLVVVGRTLLIPSKQIAPIPYTPEAFDSQRAARDLAGAIAFPTISWEGGGTEEQKKATQEAFAGFHSYLEKMFPQVYASLDHEIVGTNNLLFTWKGSDPSLKPILLMGHQDVVPVEAGTEAQWTHAPFSGDIVDGFIWGRGSLDDKMTVVGLLESVDLLLAKGFQPKRTIYLAFGQDEEIGSLEGAERIGQLLKSRGVQLAFVDDEGGFLSRGLVPGVRAPVAMIGTSEKGYLSLELTVETSGGHSSVPPKESSIGILATAIREIERHPMPARVHGPVGEFLEYAGGGASFPMRVVFKNMWLFGPVVQQILESSPDSNATLRTTAAATIFQAGTKDNVMPSQARAVVNFRLLAGDTVASVTEYVRRTVQDPRVKLQPLAGEPPAEPSAQSRADSGEFKVLQKTLAQVYPDAVAAPFVFVGATDTKHYASLTNNIFRFAPMMLETEDIGRIHGVNERISVGNFVRMIDFYRQLIRNAAS